LPKIRELLWYGFLIGAEPDTRHNRVKRVAPRTVRDSTFSGTDKA
jgi:hypothetical protein